MDAPGPLIACALLAAAALVLSHARLRAVATLGALVLTPAILVAHIWDTDQVRPLRDRPGLAAALVVAGLLLVAALAVLFARHPHALPLAAAFALPFRIPIASGGSTANLLVPLYVVIAAGALAAAVPALRRGTEPEHRASVVEWLLAAAVLLYAVQSTYSDDPGKALENEVFFYVPFALLLAQLTRVAWTRRLAVQALGVVAALAVVFAGIGFVEYATRHLFLNPKVIASNQFESYFRVNSLFFDPNIYGRFLVVVMIGLAAVLLWARRVRDVVLVAAVLAVLWAGLLTSLSQSSFAALLLGLCVLGGLRWRARWAAAAAGAVVVLGAVIVLAAPGAIGLQLGSSTSADKATSGRVDLVEGGLRLFGDDPVAGHGSGSFSRAYRRAEAASAEKAVSASHTIPVTVAAEQGIVGLVLYVALLVAGFATLLRGAAGDPVRAALAAGLAALVLHTWGYAAFLEDPLTWVLLGLGVAFAQQRRPAPARRAADSGELARA